MYYKADWPAARERFRAFWEGEIIDRCCVAVQAPRRGSRYVAPEPPTSAEALRRWWLDPEDNLARMVSEFEHTFYGGEAYPATTMCLGASVMAGFYGSHADFRRETVWYEPSIDTWESTSLSFDKATDPLYRATIDATRYYAEESRGRYLVSLPELGAATDDLSLMRGLEPLVMDMLYQPDVVKQAVATLTKTWVDVHLELFDIARPASDGGCCIAWMQTWAAGTHFQMSCDVSAVLSPPLFDEFILPEIRDYLRANEYSVYHWDGPDAVKYLDSLLTLNDLDAIQWTQGAGSPPASDPRWVPLYRQIQAAGKRLILPFVELHEIETLLSQLSSRGLLIGTTAASEEEARDLLERIPRWTRD